MAGNAEQDRSEAPTAFKLQKARERGSVARSVEPGFVASLVALAAFLLASGEALAAALGGMMRRALSGAFAVAADPHGVVGEIGGLCRQALAPVALLGATAIAVTILLELVQLRGFLLTCHPLKPDFNRLNPAAGLKRLFSARLLKETLKSIAKCAAFALATWLVLSAAVARHAEAAGDGERLAGVLNAAAMRLLLAFLLLAVGFALLDQILVRRDFLKQMRMSRREVTREARDREGEPRIKRRRKDLHKELVAQGRGMGALPGSDMLIVNPEHFAVALRYDPDRMEAPAVAAKGRNTHALTLRTQAARLGIPIVADPPLARALHRRCAIDATVPADRFAAVARHYIDLRRRGAAPDPSQP